MPASCVKLAWVDVDRGASERYGRSLGPLGVVAEHAAGPGGAGKLGAVAADAVGFGVEATGVVEPLAAPKLGVAVGGIANLAWLPFLGVAFKAGELAVVAAE